MVRKYDIEFVEADAPITEPITKFGGQPVWIEVPEWPSSRLTGTQMQFICQISLDPEIFGGQPGRMAYLFMTGYEDMRRTSLWQRSRALLAGESTWEPDGGENAVIVQPGGANDAETVPEAEGPSLYTLVDARDRRVGTVSCEYAVALEPGGDPEYVSEDELLDWNEEEFDAYQESLDGNKIGGTPGFIQSDEFPEGPGKAPAQAWRPLLQLDSAGVPFHVNFGDAGIGYAYLSEDGRSGKFLWQCY